MMVRALALILCALVTTAAYVGSSGSSGRLAKPGGPCLVINEVFGEGYVNDVQDEDSDTSGFVEVRSCNPEDFDLEGFILERMDGLSDRFTFPSLTITPGGYVRVWTNGKDDTTDTANLHAPFHSSGHYTIRLLNPRGTKVDEVHLEGAFRDTAFGRCEQSCGDRTWDFFTAPTPGAINVSSNRAAVSMPEYMGIDARRTKTIPYYTTDASIVPTFAAQDWTWVQVSSDGQVQAPWQWRWTTRDGSGSVPFYPTRETVRATADGTTRDVEITQLDRPHGHSRLRTLSLPKFVNGSSIFSLVEYEGAKGNVQGFDVAWEDWVDLDPCIYVLLGDAGVDDNIYCTDAKFIDGTDVGDAPSGLTSYAGDRLIRTPFGDFWIDDLEPGVNIYRSTDGMATWTRQKVSGSDATSIDHGVIQEGGDWYWDAENQTGHLVLGTYSANDNNHTHAVWTETYTPSTTVGDFTVKRDVPSKNSGTMPWYARHVHSAQFDPYTGDLWVGTGDATLERKLFVSYDYGDTFDLDDMLAIGEPSDRTLGIWFTPNSVWTVTDSGNSQRIFRYGRSNRVNGEWTTIAKRLSNGETLEPSAMYAIESVNASSELETFQGTSGSCNPCASGAYDTMDREDGVVLEPGEAVWATSVTPVTIDDVVYVDSRVNEYREAFPLESGTHWYSIRTPDPEDGTGWFATLSAAADGIDSSTRDDRAYVWGIRESPDGTVDIQSLFTEEFKPPATNPGDPTYEADLATQMNLQWEPQQVLSDKRILYTGRRMPWNTAILADLDWRSYDDEEDQVGFDFTRHPKFKGCWLFDNVGDLGEDSCLYRNDGFDASMTVFSVGSAPTQGTGPFGGGSIVFDSTQDQVLYYDDASNDFRDFDSDNRRWWAGCFAKIPLNIPVSDSVLFGMTGLDSWGMNRTSLEAQKVYAYVDDGGVQPTRNEHSFSSNTWFYFDMVKDPEITTHNFKGYDGSASSEFSGDLSTRIDNQDEQLVAHHEDDGSGQFLVMGSALAANAVPTVSGDVTQEFEGELSQCFYANHVPTEQERCYVCSCGLRGTASGIGRNAECGSCDMGTSTCDAVPF